MISAKLFARRALVLPEVEQHDHWGKPSFRVRGKILATLHVSDRRAVVKLSRGDQALRCEVRPEVFMPVRSWGAQGWTWIVLDQASLAEVEAALQLAWREVAPKALIVQVASTGDKPAAARRVSRPTPGPTSSLAKRKPAR